MVKHVNVLSNDSLYNALFLKSFLCFSQILFDLGEVKWLLVSLRQGLDDEAVVAEPDQRGIGVEEDEGTTEQRGIGRDGLPSRIAR